MPSNFSDNRDSITRPIQIHEEHLPVKTRNTQTTYLNLLFLLPKVQEIKIIVLPKRFHLNGHTIGLIFHSQTRKFELNCITSL